MGKYGTYNQDDEVWFGEQDETHKYALFNGDIILFTPAPEVFGDTLEQAMRSAYLMISSGIERVEIGTPSGEFITIDARDCELEGE
tara:strand:- start:15225 stop:15482 length:258 start_codon:yes stop_codon:yes gene_type:complete